MQKNLTDTFISLVECKLTAQEWLSWFDNNKDLVEKTCGRIPFLHIKPGASRSDIQNTYRAQINVYKWLQEQNISAVWNNTYKDIHEREVCEFEKLEKQKIKERKQYIKDNFAYLELLYPKFYKQLQKSFDVSNIINKGKSQLEISQKEQSLSTSFSDDLKIFFSNISTIELEGIDINFNNIYIETLNNKQFLVLGEFWCYGDGDLLLYDFKTTNIFSFAHEYQPPKIIKQSNTITEFVEKRIVKHLKAYDN